MNREKNNLFSLNSNINEPILIDGFLFNLKTKIPYLDFKLEAVQVSRRSDMSVLVRKVPFNGNIQLRAKKVPPALQKVIRQLSADNLLSVIDEIKRQVTQKNPDDPHQETIIQHKFFEKLFEQFQTVKLFHHFLAFFVEQIDPLLIETTSIKPASFQTDIPKLHIRILKGRILQLIVHIHIGNAIFSLSEFEIIGLFLKKGNNFFLLGPEAATFIHTYQKKDFQIENEQLFFSSQLPLLKKQFIVDDSSLLPERTIDEQPECKVLLSELNNSFLMIRLQFLYQDYTVEDDQAAESVQITASERVIIRRHQDFEREKRAFIQAEHKKFKDQRNHYFYLSFAEAEKSQWLVKFYNKLNEESIPMIGIEQLKHFKYNTNMPVIQFRQMNQQGDWFDFNVSVLYGEQSIALSVLQQAIRNQQHTILLKDGTLGVIPEEWFTRYALLFQLGSAEKNTLKVSRFHIGLINELLTNENVHLSNKELFKEKWGKLESLQNAVYTVPKEIKATLRNYQLAGFQWLCWLHEMNMGGCLADDMGLGKTLQTITFLQYLINSEPQSKCLIITPTSLLYNWQAEMQKFAPAIKFHVHHGQQRNFEWTEKDIQVTFTTYGSVRMDIDRFRELNFDYIILDESHVIKNPQAQATRAIQQLCAGNRIILSGTPIQNNTLDIYAQMQFLNPGVLGSLSYFKNEFVQPIDRWNSEEKKKTLKKILYPFMLRRTKEQVATDLPAKTETVLWCEMSDAQRVLYDRYKNHYREKLLNKSAAEQQTNSLLVLEGLTRLRQICNAPQLVEKESGYTLNDAVKVKMLLNDITYNTGIHKALVFSQFTSMLALIEEGLKERNIPYLYLDGSTPAIQRQLLVDRFQQDAEIPLFLVSLKAGGVGLTLTAADYVYLIDPWWNPAAEQQAIDRTYRIGQTRNVFAYRMICKDSVEEKILLLQQRKQALANELITEETGFLKKLTEEDLDFLLS